MEIKAKRGVKSNRPQRNEKYWWIRSLGAQTIWIVLSRRSAGSRP